MPYDGGWMVDNDVDRQWPKLFYNRQNRVTETFIENRTKYMATYMFAELKGAIFSYVKF